MKPVLLALALTFCLPACHRDDPQAAAQAAAAQQAADEQAAAAMEKQFDAAVAAQDWHMAKGYGDVLLHDHPASAAAARVQPKLADITAKAEQQQETRRLQGLWNYGDEEVKGGHQLSASIYSQKEVDTDGSGEHPVRLIFRDHPEWGRSAYLVLEAGDFDCYKGCKLTVTVDGKAHTLAGSRPNTDEAIAMFIVDNKALWKLAKAGKSMTIEFQTKQLGRRSATFEVGGLDPAKLPKWN